MVSVKQSRTFAVWFGIAFQLSFLLLLHYSSAANNAAAPDEGTSKPVTLEITEEYVTIGNGILTVNLSNPTGSIAGIQYQGMGDNLLEPSLGMLERGYWDIDWNRPDAKNSTSFKILGTNFTVISESKNQVEVSFKKTFNNSDDSDIPVNFDKRYVMLSGRSGLYTYAIYEHPKGAPDVDIDQTRIVAKLSRSLFHYLAVSDEIQGDMPSYEEREGGQELNYKEAVLLTKTDNPKLKGKVDDKYQYALESKDMNVYGWISPKPHMGFWVITGSAEFRHGGPIKQDLTCHCGPFALAMFLSAHYAGPDWGIRLRKGEPWKMVYGPVFLYINTDKGDDHKTLWEDAKKQMAEETKSWPYNFITSKDYPSASERGTVSGRLLVHNVSQDTPAKSAHVGLAAPGEPGSWQNDSKGYQFWTRTDADGNFKISSVRPGAYSLYAWVPGHLGDFKHKTDLNIKQGDNIKVGDLVFTPPRSGTTLWEIGISDRRAEEFFIPDPAPDLQNYILKNDSIEKFRQYGLWDRYTQLYPEDLIYKVGKSDPAKDWFFAQVNRKKSNDTYVSTIWKILFPLETVPAGNCTLRIALASSTNAVLNIWVNSDPENKTPMYTMRLPGRDNAIARHGSHGLYSEQVFDIPGSALVKGENELSLRQARDGYPFNGIMYDYIRLEGPPVKRSDM